MNSEAYRRVCINAYMNAGFSLFPCTAEKRPANRGWQEKRYVTAQSLGAVYGVRLGAAHLVLDYDARREDGPYVGMQLKNLFSLLNYELPLKTCVIKTPGGWHLYFRKPPHVVLNKMYVPHFNAIEIKSEGRYVIGAGSVTNAGVYKIVRGTLSELMELKT